MNINEYLNHESNVENHVNKILYKDIYNIVIKEGAAKVDASDIQSAVWYQIPLNTLTP